MELGRPSIVSILTALILLALIFWLAWSATKKTDAENYAKGSQHNETTYAPVKYIYPLGIDGCTPIMKVDNQVSTPITKAK